ncbi:AAT family amino acid transporter [Capronia epimyces CBS 606.96]|uniref:AAT family amino acid transporter n=1 Tax=Capronia epimyces CBS 606.96 TaxID=1182542 RepID=W9YQ81_9EURO|nr:AAT family amino acid transporter [Capronia epimyces CBS 606.96]EXJ91825.1 AAT family amino acid transporter [Capronia epimyces CBS 606.96]
MASTSPTPNGDLEKNGYVLDNSPPFGSVDDKGERRGSIFAPDRETQLRQGSLTVYHESFFSAFKPSSFQRNPNARVVTEATDNEGRPLKDQPPAEPALAMKLKQRHLQMIAIGGSIGTGLFVGSGSALATGGPASLVIAYGLIGIMLYCTVHALGEMAVLFPIAGAFSVYSSRFIDPAWGFAMGWNYALNWLVTLPLELTAASITISFWAGARDVNPAAWVILFWAAVVMINFFGVRGYGEAEFVFSIIKVVAVIGFCILGIIIAAGGVPGSPQGYLGAHYWYDPGAFNHGFKGLCSTFVTAAFSFGGTELVGLTAAETENPRKSLPTAVKQVFWRICLFYMVSLTIIGCIVPYTDNELLNGSSSTDANASPFVIAVKNAGISSVPSIMNAVILIAVLSVGNSSIYGSSRTLAALADRGQAPKFLGYIDQAGRPLFAIILAATIGLLCFIVAAGSDTRTQAFNWMLAISGLSSIVTWASICACHIRFRAAWKYNGHSTSELAFKSQPGVIGSWIGLTLNILILIAQFWTGFAPVGYAEMSAGERTQAWFEAYLSAPIIMLFYIIFKIWKRPAYKKIREIDITSGRREMNLAEILAEERAEQATWPRWKKAYKAVC